MATTLLGTNANNSLASLIANAANLPADVATIQQLIKDDLNAFHPVIPGAWSRDGILIIPNRGFLRPQPGDYVAVDDEGWPILVSANSIANSTWTVT